MAELTAEIVDTIVAACQVGVAELAQAIERCWGQACEVTIGTLEPVAGSAAMSAIDIPGLVLLLQVEARAAVLAFEANDRVVPSWCAAADSAGRSKLAALARVASTLCLPETHLSNQQAAYWLADLGEALAAAKPTSDAWRLPLEIKTAAGVIAQASLIWPLANPGAIEALAVKPADSETSSAAAAPPKYEDLPSYTRSLLKIRVPVTVMLAKKRQSLSRIIELGVGSIIHFDKSCEEMLDLEVNGHAVAAGEPVKVGDKFGLRIVGVTMPPEQFKSLRRHTS